MLRFLLLPMLFFVPVCKLPSQIVEDTNIIVDYYDPTGLGDYNLVVFQTPTGGITCVFGDISVSGSDATFSLTQTCLDEGSEWYAANLGDVFNEQTIAAGKFDILGSTDVVVNESFFLGVNTGAGWHSDGTPFRDVFGWGEFLITEDAELVMLDNAVAYNLGGLVIGSNSAIPEPSLAGILAIGLVLITRRQSR